jgi:hypothetical protein
MSSLQKALSMLEEISRRLDGLDRGEKLPLWLLQASEKSASASPTPAGLSIAPPLSKAAYGPSLSLGAGSAGAVLAALLADSATAGTVRRKMTELGF